MRITVTDGKKESITPRVNRFSLAERTLLLITHEGATVVHTLTVRTTIIGCADNPDPVEDTLQNIAESLSPPKRLRAAVKKKPVAAKRKRTP